MVSVSLHPERRSSGGFSLVEVVIALGLLGGVLVAVAGMFVMGGRHVASGRNGTEALAVGRAIVEELDGLGFHQIYDVFDDPACAPLRDVTCSVDSRANAYSVRWQQILDDSLPESWAEIRFESIDGLPLSLSRAIRVRVSVFWNEAGRARHLALVTVRL